MSLWKLEAIQQDLYEASCDTNKDTTGRKLQCRLTFSGTTVYNSGIIRRPSSRFSSTVESKSEYSSTCIQSNESTVTDMLIIYTHVCQTTNYLDQSAILKLGS